MSAPPKDFRSTDVDVIVLGGGVNGTGVARDCALRGLRVALFERNDIAYGASGNSSGMIHGGPRYLTHNPNVTYKSCLDSGHIQRIAPHLLFRIPFLVPVYSRSKWLGRVLLAANDGFFATYDRYQPLKRGKPHTLLNESELRQIEPGLRTGASGAVTFDEWGIDGVRLCIGNLVDAMEHGAKARVHCDVSAILKNPDGGVRGIRFMDRINGESGECTAPVVINATGAWAPLTAALGKLPKESAQVRPGKGIHVYLDRRITNYAIVTSAIDGRQVFLLPWQNMSVLGTTDDDFYGNLDDVAATSAEVRYLFQAVERVFPDVRHARAIGTWAGVRPTLHEWGPNEEELSREHLICDHAKSGVAGLFSMVGGKLASYRLFSEEMADRIQGYLGGNTASRTHLQPLPGGEAVTTPRELRNLAKDLPLDAIAAKRLVYRHGSRSRQIVERMLAKPSQAGVVCACEPVTEAEIHHVVEHELAATVDDVARRTRLGLGACGGFRCAQRCGQIVATKRGLAPEEGRHMAVRFLSSALKRRLPILGPQQARQEALNLAMMRAEWGRPVGSWGP